MPEPLDLDKIEEELERISACPWDLECCYGAIRHVIRNVDHDCYCSKEDEHHLFEKYDGFFIALAPERIAALVKRVKTQTEALRKIAAIGRYEIEGKIYYTATGEIAEEALPEDLKLRRGSDEV